MIEEKGKDLRGSLKTDKQVIYVDLDGVICDFDTRHLELTSQGLTKKEAFQHVDAYRDLEPMKGAIEAWHELNKFYDVYILSTASWDNVESWIEKRLWVEKYIGESVKKKLILSHNKGLLKGVALIDDRIANGVADFEGKHIHFGSEEFPDWQSVLDFLIVQDDTHE